MDGLENIDFSGVETVIIGHGLNDYYSGLPLENEKDPMDEIKHRLSGQPSHLLRNSRFIPDITIGAVSEKYNHEYRKRLWEQERQLVDGQGAARIAVELGKL